MPVNFTTKNLILNQQLVTATGSALYINGASVGDSANTAATGQQAWNAANNNGLNLSGSLSQTGATLIALINAASAGVSSLNGASGILSLQGAGNVSVITDGQTVTVSGNTGAYSSFATTLALANTGQQSWIAADNNGRNLSGNLTLTGQTAQNNAINLSGSLFATGASIASVSGGLSARIAATGAAGISYGNATFSTIANLATTGSTLFGLLNGLSGQLTTTGVKSINSLTGNITISSAGTNISISTSGQTIWISGSDIASASALAATGTLLYNRDATISGGLSAQINATGYYAILYASGASGALQAQIVGGAVTASQLASTGQQAWTAADNNGRNLSGNLTTTGATLVLLNLTTSGYLQGLISAGGTQVNVTGSSTLSIASFTGVGTNVVRLAGATVIVSGNVTPSFTGAPQTPTAALGNNTTQISTTEYVDRAAYQSTYNYQSGNYTLASGDQYKTIQLTGISSHNLFLPADSGVFYPAGTRIPGYTMGAGQTTFSGQFGAVVNSRGAAFKSAGQYASWMVEKTGSNGWIVMGDISTT